MPARRDIHTILIIGSGPIMIGQACEFDYSGNQAVKALKEEGYRVILLNPNPATVMTTPGLADAVYVDPLEVGYVEEIIRVEKPDALLATMGGQTALNLTMDLARAGILESYSVEVLGAHIHSITVAEDRGEFKKLVAGIGLESPKSELIGSVGEAREFVSEYGLPLIIRPSYTLGGRGGSIARTPAEVGLFVERALLESPVRSALVEESLIGWKEFELEVVRDKADNAVVVCSIENIDPMGVHTGDSITVAPIQTLSDKEYQPMRTAAIDILRAVGVDCGGSNVQFAVEPGTGRMVVIEMNPRVSRSSALASKATGFPIARCAAKLAVGFTLDEVMNDITGKTASCFEPALDYVAVKVPRFELEKFPLGYEELGTQMKSVGESLAIGRTFREALNKALRAAEIGLTGLEPIAVSESQLQTMLTTLHPRRLLAAYTRLWQDGPEAITSLAATTGFTPWVLHEMAEQAGLEHLIAETQGEVPNDGLLGDAKASGVSDGRIAALSGVPEDAILRRREEIGLVAGYHLVDTCAGEFQAETPYFYSTYGEIDEGEALGDSSDPAVLIIASGPNRIGQGLEFDTCCTLCSISYRRHGVKTIIVNSNPETVSTDFNVSDRLYMEPLTSEHVLEIIRKEKVKDVIVQLGGQTPLNMAEALSSAGAHIVGTQVDAIERAEDRGIFSRIVAASGLRQPRNRMAGSAAEIRRSAEAIGFPVLLRPSFVLGGRSMMIAFTSADLDKFLESGITVSEKRPVLVDQFLEDAFEYDLDGVFDGQDLYVGGIMQHIEAAGVHSGDSACVFPPYKSDPRILDEMVTATATMARELGVVGLLNVQFAVQDGDLYVIEVNPRASRTVPFLSKASGVDLVDAAVQVWQGVSLRQQGLTEPTGPEGPGIGIGKCITGWAVKEAMFSFDRFRSVDPMLGPEMRSTGESIGIGETFGEAFAKAQSAVGTHLPTAGRLFVSVNDHDKETMLPVVQELEAMGFQISATRGTADFLFKRGVFAEVILKVHEGHPNIVDHIDAGRIQLVINTPKGRYTQQDDDYIRIETVAHKIPYTTTSSAAQAAVEGIKYFSGREIKVRRLPGGSATPGL